MIYDFLNLVISFQVELSFQSGILYIWKINQLCAIHKWIWKLQLDLFKKLDYIISRSILQLFQTFEFSDIGLNIKLEIKEDLNWKLKNEISSIQII